MTHLVIGISVINWIKISIFCHIMNALTLYSMFHTLDRQLSPSHMVTLQMKGHLEITIIVNLYIIKCIHVYKISKTVRAFSLVDRHV